MYDVLKYDHESTTKSAARAMETAQSVAGWWPEKISPPARHARDRQPQKTRPPQLGL
jgi:hypothetical protein